MIWQLKNEEEDLVEQTREWKVPTRKELESRIAEYLLYDPDFTGNPYAAAVDLVHIFNQWTLEVVAPESVLQSQAEDKL